MVIQQIHGEQMGNRDVKKTSVRLVDYQERVW